MFLIPLESTFNQKVCQIGFFRNVEGAITAQKLLGKETLDQFVRTMVEILAVVDAQPEDLRQAPFATPVRCLKEVRAARRLDLSYEPDEIKSP